MLVPNKQPNLDPEKGTWLERIYYAGAAQNFMGPYTVGYIEGDIVYCLNMAIVL
jgi:hypothetical protein